MRHPIYSPWIHYFLLAGLLSEFIQLQIFSVGFLHHAWDAALVLCYAIGGGILARSRVYGLVLGLLGVIPWTMDVLGVEFSFTNVESIFWCSLHFALAIAILLSLRTLAEVSHSELIDSVSLYLAMGYAFAALYSIVLFHDPHALVVNASPGAKPPYDMVLYYSFVTQATVGYGDLSPATALTRMLSVMQAVFGVMYVAVLISRFVSIHSAMEYERHRHESEAANKREVEEQNDKTR